MFPPVLPKLARSGGTLYQRRGRSTVFWPRARQLKADHIAIPVEIKDIQHTSDIAVIMPTAMPGGSRPV
jgi:hypothetical protein